MILSTFSAFSCSFEEFCLVLSTFLLILRSSGYGFGTGGSAGEGQEGDFRADSYAGGENGLTKARVHVERLVASRIKSTELLEHEAAGAPAKEGELHRVGMAGKGEGEVLAEDFSFPMHRVMAQEDPEHSFSAFGSSCEVAFRREVA